jgi:NTE family protein
MTNRAIGGRATSALGDERSFGLLLRGAGHGAFAAGLVDELLELGIGIDAVGAAGAGVANAIAVAYGLTLGGSVAAQRSLRALWRHVGSLTREDAASPIDPQAAVEAALTRLIDFDRLRVDAAVPLFVATTNAQSGAMRFFSGREITLNAALAAMAPEAAAREISGVHYCAAGVHEEFAALPLLGDHRSSEIIAPFLSPGRRAGSLTVTRAWALGRVSARKWIAARAYRSYQRRNRAAEDQILRLAA